MSEHGYEPAVSNGPMPLEAAARGDYDNGWDGDERRSRPPSQSDNWARWMGAIAILVGILGTYTSSVLRYGALETRLVYMEAEAERRRPAIYKIDLMSQKLDTHAVLIDALDRRQVAFAETANAERRRIVEGFENRISRLEDGGTPLARAIQDDVQDIQAALAKIQEQVQDLRIMMGVRRGWAGEHDTNAPVRRP